MKKLFSVILSLAAILICGAIPASAWSAGINDMAKLYSPEEIARLEARQEEVAELTGWNIAVVTTEVGFGLDGVDACDFAEQFCYTTFGDDPDAETIKAQNGAVYAADEEGTAIYMVQLSINYIKHYEVN